MAQIFKWLSILGRHGNVYADHWFAPFGINSCHHPYIIGICREPGITQEKLCTKIHAHPSNVTRALDHLLKQGFLYKEADPRDKRTCRLYPTEKAKEVLEEIFEIERQWVEVLTEQFTGEEKEQFAVYLERAGQASVNYFARRKERQKQKGCSKAAPLF